VDLTAEISILAARVSIECRLPMADSIILATSRVHGATIWTQDSDFEEIEGVQYVAKRNTWANFVHWVVAKRSRVENRTFNA
jgi:predicted nucleic acid-binding protein